MNPANLTSNDVWMAYASMTAPSAVIEPIKKPRLKRGSLHSRCAKRIALLVKRFKFGDPSTDDGNDNGFVVLSVLPLFSGR